MDDIKNHEKKYDEKHISDADKTYLWYLCSQKVSPIEWSCEKKNAYEVLNSHVFIEQKSPTTMIPIRKFIPHVFDNMIVSRNLRSMMNIKVMR